MLYLIKFKANEDVIAGAPEQVVPRAENMIIPSLKMLAELERQKKLTGGALAGQRAGVCVMDFPSHEEAGKFVMGMPWWGLHNWHIMPLQPFQSQVEMASKNIANLKSMMTR